MNLIDYPIAIREASFNLNKTNEKIGDLKQLLVAHETEADFETAFNAELKNDNQRKTHRAELLLKNTAYQKSVGDLHRLQTDRAYIETELERLRNEFSVAKLERRLEIAQMLMGVEAREMIGL